MIRDSVGEVGFDFETTGLEVYNKADHPIGFSFSFRTKGGAVMSEYLGLQHTDRENNLTPYEAKEILTALFEKVCLMHNALFDITCARNIGLSITKYICLMKFAHLLNENAKTYDLDSVAVRYLGHKVKNKSPFFEAALIAWGWNMPFAYMHEYAKADAHSLLDIFDAMKAEALKKGEQKLFNYWAKKEAPSIIGLSKMRERGVSVVMETCIEEEEKGNAEIARITDWFGFNPGSGKNLESLLIDELGLPVVKRNDPTAKQLLKDPESKGNISFDKEAMEEYDLILGRLAEQSNDSRTGEIARELFTYRGWTKAVTGYYRPYQNFIGIDGRIRAEYKPHGTVTGRFSCATPNLQQIPKETDKVWNGRVKECLTGRDGYLLWELDYSQLEFRLAASASKEQKLLEIFADSDRDIFTEMSVDLGMTRQNTKGLTYSIQYGAGVSRIMHIFGVTAAEAKAIIDNFYRTYPNLKGASQYFAMQAKSKGYVDIWSGRRRHFTNPRKQYFKAFNSYIQGGAADIVKMVMNDCFREIDNPDCQLLLQVHDSLVWEIKIGKEQEYLTRIQEVMSRPSEQFAVNLPVDAHVWSGREKRLALSSGIELTKDGGLYGLAA